MRPTAIDPPPFHLIAGNGAWWRQGFTGAGATAAYLKANRRASCAVVVDGVAVPSLPEIDLYQIGDLEDGATWDAIAAKVAAFDTSLCLDVLEHLVDPWSAVRRCRDLLAPGGR